MICPSCHGTGKKRRLSPTGELVINPGSNPDGIGGSDGVNATNALAFIAPGVETVEFLRSDIDRNINYARGIMHLQADAPMAGGDQKTATEAGLNNRAKDAFVKPIADQLLGIYEFGVRMMGRMISGAEWDGFSLRRPTSYDLRTEADRVAEIQTARTTGLPPALIDEMEGDLIAARFSNDEAMLMAMEVIQRADRLARMAPETITAEAAAGRVQAWEVLLHYGALDLYRQLEETDPAFAALESIWDKVTALHDAAKARATSGATAPAANPALSRLNNILAR
jgi:hypothetical protein